MEAPTEVHAEDRELIQKLARLQHMHQQINDLRGLLPERLLRPTRMALENPRGVSPEKLAANLRKAASDGSRDIQRFKKDFNSPETRELFQKTSSAESPQGLDSWTIDYQTLARSIASETDLPVNQVAANSSTNAGAPEDEATVLKQYEGTQSILKINRQSQSNLYPMTVGVDNLSLQVSQQDRDGKKTLVVEGNSNPESSELDKEITRLVNESSAALTLEVLLSMLTSYHDLKFQKCAKCQNTFDNAMNYPLLRRRKTSTDKENKQIEWEALHPSCVT